ncbi:hypothetical protein HDU92_007457 [Lobulomyces angularis]|nr:hypothetical protein HDU92_007457 [Lobulomyces angularis]
MNLLSIRQFEKETDFTKKNITEKCLNSNIKLTEESNIELQDLLLKIKTEMANFKVSAKSFYSKKLEEIQLKNDSNLNEIINKSFIAIDSHTESLSSLNFKNFQSLTTHDDKQTEKNSDLNSVTNSFDQFFESYQIPFLKKRYLEFEIEKQNLTMKIKKAKR